jgi:hypothetical protein
MKFIPHTLLILLAVASIQAASIEGNIQLKYLRSGFDDGVFKQEFGDVLKTTCKWYAGDFFGEETIFAGVTVKNMGSKPMFFRYYVAFYDKDKKLVGAVGQSHLGPNGLKPGDSEDEASCLFGLPKDRYKDIVSYQAVIYETDQAPRKNECAALSPFFRQDA